MVYVGIDPGLEGAIAVLPPGSRIEFYDTPVLEIITNKKKRRQVNAAAIKLMLDSIIREHGSDVIAVIEKVAAMPSLGKPGEERRTMGATSAFNFGKGVGIWIGLLVGCQISFEEVHPATWKAAMLRDMEKGKGTGIVKAVQMFPSAARDLGRKKDHGRADALLMAAYAKARNISHSVRPHEVEEPQSSLFQ